MSSKPFNPKEGLLPNETPLLQFDNVTPKMISICTRPPPRASIADHMGSYWNQEDPLDHIREPSQKKYPFLFLLPKWPCPSPPLRNFGNIFIFEIVKFNLGKFFIFTNVSKSIWAVATMFLFFSGKASLRLFVDYRDAFLGAVWNLD